MTDVGSRKRKRVTDPGEEIAAEILRELDRSASDRRWTGAADTARRPALNPDFANYRRNASLAAKQEVQIVGATHGCHTCCTKLATDTDQPWVGDHCPPTELPNQVRRVLNCRVNTYLFPQCHNCSQQQSALVTAFKKCKNRPDKIQAIIDDLQPFGVILLKGTKKSIPKGKKGWNCLVASSNSVGLGEGLDIQTLGSTPGPRGGCHTCGSSVPVTEYIADHVVPAAFVTSGMVKLFELLEIELPPLQLRPQCTRCSTSQGGQVSKVVNRAIQFGEENRIVFTERQQNS